ncbi:MAG: hypothetical protein R3250_11085, partial [Melioribacteraceae bacterium]|nr:hypothetical protein [Melioribacteraceae bacterium]
GTPVIANITSDLGEFLHDGIEGFVCHDESAEAFAECLNRAMMLSDKKLSDMRMAALEQARISFDYHNYSETLSNFLGKINNP